MSQENVEIARAAFEAWNAGELQDVLSHFHPELVYHPRADEPDPSPHVGRDAYERLVYGFVDSFSEVTFEVLELIDAGDHVIASTVLHAGYAGREVPALALATHTSSSTSCAMDWSWRAGSTGRNRKPSKPGGSRISRSPRSCPRCRFARRM
jgi:ketosteroid isomerase-like protein